MRGSVAVSSITKPPRTTSLLPAISVLAVLVDAALLVPVLPGREAATVLFGVLVGSLFIISARPAGVIFARLSIVPFFKAVIASSSVAKKDKVRVGIYGSPSA